MDSLADWITANRLSINYDKTCYIVFSPKQSKTDDLNLSLTLNHSPIKRVSSSTYLGVIIDDNLNWKLQISEICLVLRRFIGVFYKLSSVLPWHTLKLLYFSLVYPRILYGIELYANNYMVNLHDLIVLNNRLLRIIHHKSRDTKVIELCFNYSTLPINKLFQFQYLLLAHSLLYNINSLPSIIASSRIINNEIRDHNTRSSLYFHKSFPNSSVGSKMSINIISKLWNALPNELKCICSLTLFKTQ